MTSSAKTSSGFAQVAGLGGIDGVPEVTVLEVKEVLRQWLAGAGKKKIAARIGLDPKAVRRYVRANEACGLTAGQPDALLTDASIAAVLAELGGAAPREHGEAWQPCVAQRPFVELQLQQGVRLSKVRRLLLRQGVSVPYSTLHRFAAVELGFGRAAATLSRGRWRAGSRAAGRLRLDDVARA